MNAGRILLGAGGLAGAAGVALAAQAAHGGGAFTQTISSMLLFHAALFVGIGASDRIQTAAILRVAAFILLFGVVLFCADLQVRDMGMDRLFPMAAPVGGTAMIAGWLGIAFSALFRGRA